VRLPLFLANMTHAARFALVKGIPLFPGCASCPDGFSWRERRARLPDPDFPVDFVYTWVDGDDPSLAAKRAAYEDNAQDSPGEGPSRFRDNGELRYALRSLEAHAPWVNRVFIVTDGQVPSWLNTFHPQIRIVDHSECIPAEYLPTFSSRVIEAHLHRIHGLAEHYVYCNDDFFLLSPCLPKDFFTAAGQPYIFTDWRGSRRRGYARGDTPHSSSYANARVWLKRKGASAPDVIAAHVPYPQSRSNAVAAYAFYEDFIREFCTHRFRDFFGMVFTCHGAPLWAYLARRAVPCDMPYYYLNSRRYDRKVYYASMLREKNRGTLPLFLCINDTGAAKAPSWRKDMLDFLDAYYPRPSAFERERGAA
jgi:hypothetical protein